MTMFLNEQGYPGEEKAHLFFYILLFVYQNVSTSKTFSKFFLCGSLGIGPFL